jgi:hypothetical protein
MGCIIFYYLLNMAHHDRLPVIEHGRKHTQTASIIGRRLLDFGSDIVPPARYLLGEATTVRLMRGSTLTHSSLAPTILPFSSGGFNRTYHGVMDQKMYYVDHSFTGIESHLGTIISSGSVIMRNEEGMGRAELDFGINPAGGRRATLRQATARADIAKFPADELHERTAAALMRAVLLQHGRRDRREVQSLKSIDDLFPALTAISPAVKIEREAAYDTSREGTFNFSQVRITEDVRQRQRKPPVTISQTVSCTGLRNYAEYPGIVGTVSLSVATGPQTSDAIAALQASIDIPEKQSLTISERNHILNDTVREYQSLDGFFEVFNRQLEAI